MPPAPPVYTFEFDTMGVTFQDPGTASVTLTNTDPQFEVNVELDIVQFLAQPQQQITTVAPATTLTFSFAVVGGGKSETNWCQLRILVDSDHLIAAADFTDDLRRTTLTTYRPSDFVNYSLANNSRTRLW